VARIPRVGGAVAMMVLIAACGSSEGAAPTTVPPTTTAPPTTLVTTTTLPPTTTTLDCHSFGDAMRAIAQSFLYQTMEGGAALESQRGDQLADSLLAVSMTIGGLRNRIEGLGEPLAGFEEAVGIMLEAIEMDEEGYAAAADAARVEDQAALDAAVAMVDEGFWRLVDANVALSVAQGCSLQG